jgi:hypothetical protein
LTFSLGPLIWIRYGRCSRAPGWWRGIALALVWDCCLCPLLVGLVYGVAVVLFDLGR